VSPFKFITSKVLQGAAASLREDSEPRRLCVCVCLLLQDLLQSCSRGGRRRVEDMASMRDDEPSLCVWVPGQLPITHW